MKHSGTVLLITLFLIAIMSSGIALLVAQSDQLLDLSKRSQSDMQISKISSDLKRLLPNMLSKVGSAHDLEYMMILPLQSRSADGHFSLNASLHSAVGRFNINKICDKNGKPLEPYSTFLLNVFARYPIAQPQTFINILYDTMDLDFAERQARSEIAVDFSDFHNGSIENFAQFNQIIARYLALTKDRQILEIPWEKIIGFEGDKIDINYASPELVSILVPQIDSVALHRLTDLKLAPFESKEEVLSVVAQLSSSYDTWFFVYRVGVSYPLIGEISMALDGVKSEFEFHTDMLTHTFNNLKVLQ